MASVTLYYCPRTCSEVTLCALEEASIRYDLKLINILAGEQLRPEYLAISPLNKVPAMVVDGEALTENIAILSYIARLAPQSGVLPAPDADPMMQARALSGLALCASTLHPLLRGMLAPQRLTSGDHLDAIKQKSAEMLAKAFDYAERRVRDSGWWLTHWSIVDVYLNWTVQTAQRAGFDAAAFPALFALSDNLLADKPSFQRMRDIGLNSAQKMGLQ